MKANKLIGTLACAAVLFSCEKAIEYKGEGKDPLLVVNALQQNDSTFKVYLERSFFFLSDENLNDKYIKTGAIVKVTNLSTNEVFTMTQSTYDNVYEFPFITAASTKYKIEVSHTDYPSVSSEITTVPAVSLTDVDTSGYSEDGSLYKKATLKWNDPAGENFYLLRLYYEDPLYDYLYQLNFTCKDEVTNGTETEPFTSEDPSFYELLFSDELFNGEN